MKKTRRRYDTDFKISVLPELDSGKPLAQVTREYGIHPVYFADGRQDWPRILKKYSEVMGKSTKFFRGRLHVNEISWERGSTWPNL